MARRRSTGTTTGRTWLIRAGVGIAVGILVGFATGAAGVRYLQPPGVVSTDSAADSTRKPKNAANATEEPAEPETEKPKDGVVVPQLVDLEEGDARAAIVHAGFTVGSVTFKADSKRMGTVVATFPVPGEAVPLPASISLILSDGKGRPDSLTNPPQF
ncbi:MAG: PASTA domain-containing protein [Gemmatimonadaceae bacterium]